VVIGFIVISALYVYVTGTALDFGENYRYRFLIEPLFFVLAGVAVVAGVRALRRSRAPSPG
jgi:hypothetical protein